MHICYWVISYFTLTDQKRADVVAEAEKRTDTATETGIETEIGIETGTGIGTGEEMGGDGTVLDLGPGPAPGIVTDTEIETEIMVKEETSLTAGLSVHPALEKTRTRTLSAGKTNTWTGLLQRSLLWATFTTEKLPASCSLAASFSSRV